MSKKLPKITIAIDGYSSTGKSTVAKSLAKTLEYVYIDTGAMYRAVTFYALQNDLISKSKIDKEAIINSLKNIKLEFKFNDKLGFAEMYLNGKNIESAIRTMEVSDFVSPVAAIPEVRKFLVSLQQKMGEAKGVVMDGRDIGSVVLPDAELKIFLIADAKIRAERRLLEMQEKGQEVAFDTIYKNVLERDHIDSTRADSPLIKVKDAIEIDASAINKEEQFQKILSLAHQTIIAKKEKLDFSKKTK